MLFFSMQFRYCALVWMFLNRSLNNRINKLQGRSLRLANKDTTSSFNKLLEKENTFTVDQSNNQKLANEMYK